MRINYYLSKKTVSIIYSIILYIRIYKMINRKCIRIFLKNVFNVSNYQMSFSINKYENNLRDQISL